MAEDNRELLRKADTLVADLTSSGGLMKPEQAQKFIRLAIKESMLLPQIRVVPMKSPEMEVDKIRFGSRILRPAQEATALAAADRAKPNLSKVTLSTKPFKAEIRMSDEVLEDNIEQEQLRNTVLALIAGAVGRDMEEVGIQGDTTSSDAFLAQFDGVLAQATSHTVSASGVRLNKGVFRDMVKTMPLEYRRDKRSMKLFTSSNAEIDYRDSLAERATVMGDKFLADDGPITYAGIQVDPIPMMPENLLYGGAYTHTNGLFLDPKNIVMGVHRDVKIKTGELISEGVVLIVVSVRFVVKYEHEDAVVKATDILVG